MGFARNQRITVTSNIQIERACAQQEPAQVCGERDWMPAQDLLNGVEMHCNHEREAHRNLVYHANGVYTEPDTKPSSCLVLCK